MSGTGEILVVGLGPGPEHWRTPEVSAALERATDLVGYDETVFAAIEKEYREFAKDLGFETLAAIPVSFVGTIGFVGLVGPHIARMLVGEDQRFLIPLSALCGALMLSTASVVSKSIVPGALFPIGIVTALIGVPFFIWLVLSQRGRGRA